MRFVTLSARIFREFVYVLIQVRSTMFTPKTLLHFIFRYSIAHYKLRISQMCLMEIKYKEEEKNGNCLWYNVKL